MYKDITFDIKKSQHFSQPPWRTGGHGFEPRPRYTKVTVKNNSSCSSLGTQTYGVELGMVDPVSV